MEKICGIYMIKNKINNKVYIGQSTDIKSRWAFEHKIRPNKYFDNAWKKYGEEAFEFSILKECKKEDLNSLEFFYQCVYCSFDKRFGYNEQIGWTHGWKYVNEQIKNGKKLHPMTGHVWTDEQRKTMSKGRKGKYKGEEHYFANMTEEEKKNFVKEKCGAFTAPWWNNGEKMKRSFDCPGEGWVKGYLDTRKQQCCDTMKGMKFFNNGIINIRAKVCPDGFVPGMLRKSKTN